jgi:hypothetical protein
MKVERKLSDFFAEKWKQNEYMKMETEFCGTETEILWRKWKRKRNNVFQWNRGGNGTTFSGGTEEETETSVSD